VKIHTLGYFLTILSGLQTDAQTDRDKLHSHR